MKLVTFAALAAAIAISATTTAADSAAVSLRQASDRIDFLAGNELAASYVSGAGVPKPYFWPLNAPGGTTVTRAWPMEKGRPGELTNDHVHQKSAWFCHGDVLPVGLELKQRVRNVEGIDFWAEPAGHGVIACVGVEKPAGNLVVTRNEWRTADGRTVLDERRTIGFRVCAGGYLWSVRSELRGRDWPITFGDTKEGSFGVRVSDQLMVKGNDVRRQPIRNPKSVITNAEGKQGEQACWGHVSKWCDYSGEIGGKAVGVAVFADPANKYPTCWHVRDYGLLAANPFGRAKSGFPAMQGQSDLVRLNKGETLNLRYGIFTHSGDASAGKVAEAFGEFAKSSD